MRGKKVRLGTCGLVAVLIAELVVPGGIPKAHAGVMGEPAFTEEIEGVRPPSQAKGGSSTNQVSATGAFGYSIPIQIPPGRNGAAPSLQLTYSSDAVDEPSAFGVGWSLPLSVVRR